MAELVGQRDEIALGVDDGLLDEVGALFEKAAQEMRLAGAGIALDEQTRRQELFEIEQGRLSSGGGGCLSHVDASLHQPPSCQFRSIRHGPNTARLKEVPGDRELSTGEMPCPQPRRRRIKETPGHREALFQAMPAQDERCRSPLT